MMCDVVVDSTEAVSRQQQLLLSFTGEWTTSARSPARHCDRRYIVLLVKHTRGRLPSSDVVVSTTSISACQHPCKNRLQPTIGFLQLQQQKLMARHQWLVVYDWADRSVVCEWQPASLSMYGRSGLLQLTVSQHCSQLICQCDCVSGSVASFDITHVYPSYIVRVKSSSSISASTTDKVHRKHALIMCLFISSACCS